MEPYNPGTQMGGTAPGTDPAQQLKIPAIFLIVLGALATINAIWSVVSHLMGSEAQPDLSQLPTEFQPFIEQTLKFAPLIGFVSLILAVLTLLGGIMMLRRQAYGLALAGAITASIPCLHPCICLALPFGVWALVILLRPETKAAFTGANPGGPGSGPSGPGFTNTPSSGPGFGAP